MKTGLVSVTFRQLSVSQIIEIAKKTNICSVEWGGDVHVPNVCTAKEVALLMKENGLETISYGSYYKAGVTDPALWRNVVDIAVELGALNIRVWAGELDREKATNDYIKAVETDLFRIATLAQEQGITVSLEYHGNTLTNTQQSTISLLNTINHKNLYTYWQPLANTTHEENVQNIKELCRMGKLKHIHAYYWKDYIRFPLRDNEKKWTEYIKAAYSGCEAAILEFVRDDSVKQFEQDALTLNQIVDIGF